MGAVQSATVTPNGKSIAVAATCVGVSIAASGMTSALDYTFQCPSGQDYWARNVVGAAIQPGQAVTITFASN